jgi:hypothetical protein
VKHPATPTAATTTPPATASKPSETASKSADDAASPAAAASSSAAAASAYAEVATTPAAAAKGWTSWLFIPLAAAVIVIGTLATFLSKWRKHKLVEQAGEENLSFSNEVVSEHGEVDKPVVPKAA